VTYAIPRAGPVRVTVHDLQGRRVAVLAAGHAEAGSHEVSWDGRDSDGGAVAAGTYLVRLEGPGGLAATKLVLQK
jgi:flagellar hook assembly protein FlgD